MKNYMVVRICNKLDGTVVCPISTFEGETDAWKEFYRLCGLAVDSTHLTDTVVIMTKYGEVLEGGSKHFTHEAS